MLFQFKIQLQYLDEPQVWRQMLAPDHFTFHRFHAVIQTAFGWENSHMYEFSPKGYGSHPSIGLPAPFDDWDTSAEESLDSKKIKLSEIFKKAKQKYIYIYDFGDDWMHEILLEKILDEKRLNAELLAGGGACPPEDCGGVDGYLNLLEVLADPKDPEHKEMKEWLGLSKKQTWDANAFNLAKTALMVRKI